MTTGILLTNPKYAHNVGQVVRAASCFNADFVWFTGDRVSLEGSRKDRRLPREERMRDYQNVDLQHITDNRPFDRSQALTPVAVEFTENAQDIRWYDHPEDAMYVFGPEDGGLPKVSRLMCHEFITIPTAHCVNLSAAVYITLYDRMLRHG